MFDFADRRWQPVVMLALAVSTAVGIYGAFQPDTRQLYCDEIQKFCNGTSSYAWNGYQELLTDSRQQALASDSRVRAALWQTEIQRDKLAKQLATAKKEIQQLQLRQREADAFSETSKQDQQRVNEKLREARRHVVDLEIAQATQKALDKDSQHRCDQKTQLSLEKQRVQQLEKELSTSSQALHRESKFSTQLAAATANLSNWKLYAQVLTAVVALFVGCGLFRHAVVTMQVAGLAHMRSVTGTNGQQHRALGW